MTPLLEHWKPIRGFEGYYSISNAGNVRRDRAGSRTHANKLLKPLPNSNGYVVLTLCVDGARHKRAVHQLVAEHFLGARPDGLQVNHRDGWKAKNWASNLEYETPRGNVAHASRTGLCGEAAMTPEKVDEARRLSGVVTQEEMAARLGVTIHQIKTVFRARTRARRGAE